MTKEVMMLNIAAKLERNLKLTKAQVAFVQGEIEPKYTNTCELCRINVAMACGLTPTEAFKALANSDGEPVQSYGH